MENKKIKVGLWHLIKFYSSHKWPFIFLIITNIIYVSAACIFPVFLKWIMDDVVKLQLLPDDGDLFNKISYFSISALGIAFISVLASITASILGVYCDVSSSRKIRLQISQKFNSIPLKTYDNNTTGNMLSYMTNDATSVEENLTASIFGLFSAVIMVLGIVVSMFIVSWQLALSCLACIPVTFGIMFFILFKTQKYFKAQQEDLARVNGKVEEIFSGNEIVTLFNLQKHESENFIHSNRKLKESNQNSSFYGGLLISLFSFASNFSYCIVVLVCAFLMLYGSDPTSWLVLFPTFVLFVSLLNVPLSKFGQGMSSLQIAVASYERIQTFLSSEELTEDIHGIKIKKISGRVNFNNVSFSYAPDRQIINNFSIKIPSGAKVAIVGPTGAGKTTIVNLLMRFYDIEKGAIEIDGVDTKLMTRDYLSSLFSMVLQDPWLYKTTIMENIRYTTKNVDDNKVKSICKLINLDHIVKSLPNGYDTIVDDKISLSSGEKQLITIARALVHDAPIVILDEATSNVDTKTEQVIQNAMVELVNNKTAFIIAHRLSTIKNSDIIIVMNNGSIVEYGNHYELLERKQFYANLYNSQFSE